MPHTIFVGAYSNVIKTLEFDPSASPATLQVIGSSPAGTNPSWVALHPTDKSLLFATNEDGDEGKVLLFKIKSDKTLELIHMAWSGGGGTCHLHIGEDEVVAANYVSGTALTIPLSLSPPALLAPSSQPVKFAFPGLGPIKDRQEGSHPHQIYPHPSGTQLLVPDLGSDKVWILVKDPESKSWKVNGSIPTPPGSGPRHIAVKGHNLYVVDEITSSVTQIHEREISTVPSLKSPSKVPENMLAAEILLAEASSPFPEPLLYVSNRNDTHPEGDVITIYTPADGTTQFELVGEVRTGLHHLRAVAFCGQDDKYVVVGGLSGGFKLAPDVKGGGIKVFERVNGGRSLKEVAFLAEEEVQGPTSFVVL